MPNSYDVFPSFFKTRTGALYAVLAKDRMFHLNFTGNRGDGFEFRIYKTRKTVLKHQGTGQEISFSEFKMSLTGVFADYMLEITSMLPLALRQPDVRPAIGSKSPAIPYSDAIEVERAVDYVAQSVSRDEGVDDDISTESTHAVFMGKGSEVVYDGEGFMCYEVARRLSNKYPGVSFNVKSLV